MKYLIGSDPEMFFKDIDTGKIGSVIGKLGGTKDVPIAIGNGCMMQEDNILAEFNIPPVQTLNDFVAHLDYSKEYIATLLKGNNLVPHYSSSEMVSDFTLDIDDKSKVFGCAPSINIISETISSLDMDTIPAELVNLRTSGFHIHFGYDNPTDEQNDRLVLAFELMTSLPLARFDNDIHDRRQFYGKFGDCRTKDYGVECRSLGGYFLKDHETMTKVWKGIENTIALADSTVSTEELREMCNFCIDEGDIANTTNIDQVLKDLAKVENLQTVTTV